MVVKVGKSIAGNEMPNTVIKDVQCAQICHLQEHLQLQSNISRWAGIPIETVTAVVSLWAQSLWTWRLRHSENGLRDLVWLWTGCGTRVFHSSSQCDHDKGRAGSTVLWHKEKFGLCSVSICRSLGLGHFRWLKQKFLTDERIKIRDGGKKNLSKEGWGEFSF